MCQIVPFTLPCCRRTYVGVTRLPSCPQDWPKSKCPPELCIQVFYEADHRQTGTCWRCKAAQSSISHEQREGLRPGLDAAYIVTGLEELGPAERRRRSEEAGSCWFCESTATCGTCGDGVVDTDIPAAKPSSSNKRKVDKMIKPYNKQLKLQSNSTPSRARVHVASVPRTERYWQDREDPNGISHADDIIAEGNRSGGATIGNLSHQLANPQSTEDLWQQNSLLNESIKTCNLDPYIVSMSQAPPSNIGSAQSPSSWQYQREIDHQEARRLGYHFSIQGVQPRESLDQLPRGIASKKEQIDQVTTAENNSMLTQDPTADSEYLIDGEGCAGQDRPHTEDNRLSQSYSYPSPKQV